MRILRVFNNNVVLASRDDGTEVVVTGRGVGFQARAGMLIDAARVTRVFVPDEGRNPDHLAAMAAAVPPEYVDLAARLEPELGTGALVALADHIHGAHQRGDLGPHPLAAEVAHLYPEELKRAQAHAAAAGLPESEATAIALHLVNAAMMSGNLQATYLITGVFAQLFDIIDESFGVRVDRDGLSAARFITHMRYFFARVNQGQQLEEGTGVLTESLEASAPQAVECARYLASILELRLGVELTADELAYLALHVMRLSQDL